MAKKSYVFTKEKLNAIKQKDAKASPAKRRAVSEALVKANSEANTPSKKKKA